MDNPALLSIHGKEVKNNDVIVHLKVSGKYRDALHEMISIRAMQVYAESNNIEVTDEELQDFVNSTRSKLNLLTTDATRKYLSNLGINDDQWIDALEINVLEKKIKDQVVTNDKIELYFKENSHLFTEMALYKITVLDKNAADEIYMEAVNDEKDFRELAYKHCEDENLRLSSGFAGWVKRNTYPVKIENKIFTANEGDVFGPVEDAGKHSIFKVAKIKEAKLDDDLKKEIKSTLFNIWKNNLIHSLKIEIPQQG